MAHCSAPQSSAIITGVTFQIAEHQTEGYTVSTDMYEGPLDLLLELIQRAELDITRFALSQVTDQYLEYMRSMPERSAAEVSAFLVVAARLLQIKSSALLPRPSLPPVEGEEEDPGEALARHLIIYKRFKELATNLEKRQSAGLRTYVRLAPSPKISGAAQKVDLAGLTLADLARIAGEVFNSQLSLPELSEVVSLPRITISEKITNIIASLKKLSRASFRTLMKQPNNRLEVVVTFLAMLELIKRHVIVANQPALFADIQIETSGDLGSLDDLAIEFEE